MHNCMRLRRNISQQAIDGLVHPVGVMRRRSLLQDSIAQMLQEMVFRFCSDTQPVHQEQIFARIVMELLHRMDWHADWEAPGEFQMAHQRPACLINISATLAKQSNPPRQIRDHDILKIPVGLSAFEMTGRSSDRTKSVTFYNDLNNFLPARCCSNGHFSISEDKRGKLISIRAVIFGSEVDHASA